MYKNFLRNTTFPLILDLVASRSPYVILYLKSENTGPKLHWFDILKEFTIFNLNNINLENNPYFSH